MTQLSVYDRIREKIVSNEIVPGERVSIDGLVKSLGVSRTPVREALHRLEGDGLVERVEGRGYATTSLLDEPQLRSMFRVRMLLEPWAARVVSADRISNPGRRLIRFVEDFRREHSGICSRTDLAAHDLGFHRMIHRATGNVFLQDAYESLHPQLHLFRLYAEDIESDSTLDEHSEVARAIASCDGAAAEELMRGHLENSLLRFLPELGAKAGLGEDLPSARQVLPTS